jgi:hypothetical protein
MEAEIQIGDVIFFNQVRGYGFISDASNQSHYFHVKFIEHLPSGARPIPRVGDLFHFHLRPSTSKNGADEAYNLRLIRRAPAQKAGA